MLFLFLHFLSYIPGRNLIIFLELTSKNSFYIKKSQQATCLFMLIKVNSISKKKKKTW